MPNSRSGVHRPSRTSDIRLRRDPPPPSARGDTLQSGYQDVLSAIVWGGQSQEGGPDRLHAETADHPERDVQTSASPAPGPGSVCLTVKTVADHGSLQRVARAG